MASITPLYLVRIQVECLWLSVTVCELSEMEMNDILTVKPSIFGARNGSSDLSTDLSPDSFSSFTRFVDGECVQRH